MVRKIGNYSWIRKNKMGKAYKTPSLLEVATDEKTSEDIKSFFSEAFYLVKQEAEITEFLQLHPYIISVLKAGTGPISAEFPETKPILKYLSGDEEGEEPYLMVFLPTSLDYKEAGNKLNNLDNIWWSEAFIQAKGKMNIDLEFQ